MARKSTAQKPPMTHEQCRPLLGTYVSSTGGMFLTAWQDGGFGMYRLPLTGPGQSKHLTCAHAFKRLLSFGAFTLVKEERAKHFLDDFTVLDLEFQGTDLLEVGAIRYQQWQVVGQVQEFVRFRGEIGWHVEKLTGITKAHVWNALPAKDVLQKFRQLAGDSLLVCHNLAADRRVLEAARTQLGATAPLPNQWFCTLALSKQRLPGRKHGLGELCNDFGIATHGAHRALRDAQMCAGLLHHLHQLEPINGPLLTAKARKAAAQPSLFANAA